MVNEMLNEADLCLLNKPTPNSEKKYRIGRVFDTNNGKGTALTYVDARYVMDTLDDVVGCSNWSDSFERIGNTLFCTITITFLNIAGKVCTVSKTDCGTESNVEKEKGESSDAFKRCAVKFGVGRDLYSQGVIFIGDGDGLVNKMGKWTMPFGWQPAEAEPITDGGWITDEQKTEYQTLLSHKCFTGKKRDTNNWFGKFQTFEQGEKALGTMRVAIAKADGKEADKMLKEKGFTETKKVEELVNEDS